MPDQPIASVAALGSEETVKYLKDISTALIEIWDSIDKTGKAGDQILGYMKEMPTIQQNMLNNMQQSLAVDQQLLTATTQRHALLKSMNDLKKQGLDYDKEGLDTEEKKRLAESRRTAGQLMHPLATVEEKGLGMLGGPMQVAAILGLAALSTGGEEVSRMRQITRTGGMGMMEGMGGEAGGMESAMRYASMSIPFLKERYGSMQELTAGAATMYGQGGIRGENLTEVMEFLPKAAHEAGMSFQDASNIMAKANRVFAQSPKELEEGFKVVTDAAKEAGYKVSDFTKFVYDSSFKLAQYGVTTEEMSKASKDLYENTLKGKISAELLSEEFVKGTIHGEALNETEDRLTKVNRDAIGTHTGFLDVLKLRHSLEAVMANRTETYSDAVKKAESVTAGFAEAINKGRISIEEVSMANDVLTKNFGYTNEKSSEYAAGLSETARKIGFSGPELLKTGLDLSQTFQKIIHDPEDAAKTGSLVAMKFATSLRDLDISSGDLNKMFSFTTEKLRMLPGEASRLTEHFITLSKETGTSVSSIINWHQQMTSGLIPFSDTVRDASKMATMALNSSTSLFDSGKISVSDYTQVMKTQMNVFGQDLTSATGQFNLLANVVDKTNIRMEELASQTAELSKINKQYGFDQQVSDALLVNFNEGLRTGAISMGDIKAAMGGAGGASEGIRAMVAGEMMQGGMFEGMNISAAVNIGIPEAQRTGGKNFGDKNKIDAAYRRVINRLVGTAGGGNETNQLNAFLQLSEAITGHKMDAYGTNLENISEMVRSGHFSDAMEKITDAQKKGGVDPNDPYNKFKATVHTLSSANAKFSRDMEGVSRTFYTAVHDLVSGRGQDKPDYMTGGPGIKKKNTVRPTSVEKGTIMTVKVLDF